MRARCPFALFAVCVTAKAQSYDGKDGNDGMFCNQKLIAAPATMGPNNEMAAMSQEQIEDTMTQAAKSIQLLTACRCATDVAPTFAAHIKSLLIHIPPNWCDNGDKAVTKAFSTLKHALEGPIELSTAERHRIGDAIKACETLAKAANIDLSDQSSPVTAKLTKPQNCCCSSGGIESSSHGVFMPSHPNGITCSPCNSNCEAPIACNSCETLCGPLCRPPWEGPFCGSSSCGTRCSGCASSCACEPSCCPESVRSAPTCESVYPPTGCFMPWCGSCVYETTEAPCCNQNCCSCSPSNNLQLECPPESQISGLNELFQSNFGIDGILAMLTALNPHTAGGNPDDLTTIGDHNEFCLSSLLSTASNALRDILPNPDLFSVAIKVLLFLITHLQSDGSDVEIDKAYKKVGSIFETIFPCCHDPEYCSAKSAADRTRVSVEAIDAGIAERLGINVEEISGVTPQALAKAVTVIGGKISRNKNTEALLSVSLDYFHGLTPKFSGDSQ